MEKLLTIGSTLKFLNGGICRLITKNTNGEHKCWAKGDDKSLIKFIKSQDDFYKFIMFLEREFGCDFRRRICFCEKDMVCYELIGVKNKSLA